MEYLVIAISFLCRFMIIMIMKCAKKYRNMLILFRFVTKQIEPEIMCRLMNDNRIKEISSSVDIRGLNLLDSRATVGSLSENDEYSYDEMERFWSNSRNIRKSFDTGFEQFPREMLNPK